MRLASLPCMKDVFIGQHRRSLLSTKEVPRVCVDMVFPKGTPELGVPQPCYEDTLIPAWGQLKNSSCLRSADIQSEDPHAASVFATSVAAVRQEIERLEKGGVELKRIVLGGQGQGGAVALQTALSFRKPLAGCIVFSGWLTQEARELLDAGCPPDTPVLFCHGADDDIVGFDCGLAAQRALDEAGIKLRFEEYAGMGHGVCVEGLVAMSAFLHSTLVPESNAPDVDWENAAVEYESQDDDIDVDDDDVEHDVDYVSKPALESLKLDVEHGRQLSLPALEPLKDLEGLADDTVVVPLRTGLLDDITKLLREHEFQHAQDSFLQGAKEALWCHEAEMTAGEWKEYVNSDAILGEDSSSEGADSEVNDEESHHVSDALEFQSPSGVVIEGSCPKRGRTC
eukprot:TRINITY_DN5813_c0_g5_i2.p1 TRINITY_DN5813_c0_g5~~TRINITY_DN5813_c0_g5_i2.p1  ORF type:complete len:397 (+),score=57.44 TRINITY_DN5813_c0_g5_i2:2-1192(+)